MKKLKGYVHMVAQDYNLEFKLPYDDVLKLTNRGHTIKDGIDGIAKRKMLVVKLFVIFMPDLPGSSPEMDKNMWDVLASDQRLYKRI